MKISRVYSVKPMKFAVPLVGGNGARLETYSWCNEHDEAVPDSYHSDWNAAEESDHTGRRLVHLFGVAMPDGEFKTVSAESAALLLGCHVSKVKSAAAKMMRKACALSEMPSAQRERILEFLSNPDKPVQEGEFCRGCPAYAEGDKFVLKRNGEVWMGGKRDRGYCVVYKGVVVHKDGHITHWGYASDERIHGMELTPSDFGVEVVHGAESGTWQGV